MGLTIGSQVGSYSILSAIGAGGMGEVYRARDTKLGRDVAVKVLPKEFEGDADRLARFQREAQVLASLNHPNIAQIYGLEDSGPSGARCIVMELVEGESLGERLKAGPIPIDEAIRMARDLANALEAAHERGIVHRDLKPGNIMVTPDGKVKVLDFGLAKAIDDTRSPNVSNSPTLSMAVTQQGVVLGTAGYMSPEQARGRTVDERADVWAFGCVFYEMLTGKRVFEGSDASEILAGVIKSEPVWAELPGSLPPILQVFLRRCLEKDPRRRVHDIGDVRLALEGAFDVPAPKPAETVSPAPPRFSKPKLVMAIMMAIIMAAAVTGWISWTMLRTGPQPLMRLDASLPGGVRAGTANVDQDLAISPDGRHIVFETGQSLETNQLYVRSIDSLDAEPLRGISGARNPVVSPDGNWVAYFDGAQLKKVAINGGPPITLCTFKGAPRGASWGPNEIIFSTSDNETGLLRVPPGGGDVEILTKPDIAHQELDHQYPEILPGGRAVLFTIIPQGNRLDGFQIAVLDLATGNRKILIPGGTNPRYARSGHIVYAVAGSLRAMAFDLRRLEVYGNPVPVVEHVQTKATGAANFAISQDGLLAYVTGNAQGSGDRALVWVDRTGHEEPIPAPPRAYTYVRLSPDGTRLALDIRDQENDVWIWDFMRQNLLRLTFDPGLNRGVAWSPDGKRIAFSAQRDGAENVYWQAADGSGMVSKLTQGATTQLPSSFTPDGARLLVMEPGNPPYDIGVVDVKGSHNVELLLHSQFSQLNGEVSPDGRLLAYESNESGTTQVYVRPFPDVNSGRWQASTGGGTRPAWSHNGRELFYLNGNKMMSVAVQSGSAFAPGSPQMLFQGDFVSAAAGRTYDVSADGRHFLMVKDARPADSSAPQSQLVVVLNWFDELKRLVPVR